MKWLQRARMRKSVLCAGALTFALCVLAFAQATPNSEQQVMGHLNLVLRWAQRWESTNIYFSRPGDQLYMDNGRSLAREVTRLEFQSALAQAALIGSSSKSTASSAGSPIAANVHNIFLAQQRIDQQEKTLEGELDAVNRQIASARAKDRGALETQRSTLQGQLQLAQALQENLHKLTAFMISSDNASSGMTALTGKILALERVDPDKGMASTSGKRNEKSAVAAAHPATVVGNSRNSGLVGQMGQLIHFVQSTRALSQLKDETTKLQTATQHLRAPLLATLRSTLKQGQIELSGAGQSPSQPTPETAPVPQPLASEGPNASAAAPATAAPETAAQKQQAMTDLVQHFKLLSKATLPLSQELILMDRTQANLTQLQAAVRQDYLSVLRSILLKVASILIALGLIWLFSELWRRAAFRYIREARRRRQFLVLRRVVTGFFMVIVIVLGFVSDFSSLATYAGLITAGVAVALQALILSVAAYFFLVGRYGVKVGDRITVVYAGNNSVAGDVVDIGLVRFYMMELAGSGIDMQPTGRICVFPNSVLFQTNPLYKQFPGAEYSWREIGLPLSADSDGELAEKELLAAVNRLFDTYHQTLEVRQASLEATMGIPMKTPQPYTRRRFVASGVEVMVRYPIPLRQAGELDDRMVMEVTKLLRENPSIKLAAGAAPDMRSPVKI